VRVGSAGKPSTHRPFEPRADERVEDERPRAADAGVSEALQALPAGKYGIGLPFQGEFFPIDEWFDVLAKKAVDDAKGGDPAPITSPSLEKFVTGRYTATWNKDKTNKKGDPAPDWDFAASGAQ
jgi:hypothetical protein